MASCPVTGGKRCHCNTLQIHQKATELPVDLRSAVRVIFTEHAVYTSYLILESLPTLDPDAAVVKALTERLLRNPHDMADLLAPKVGVTNATNVQQVFTKHLELAAATLEPARLGDTDKLTGAVTAFVTQGNDVARVLYSLNPSKLPLADMEKEMTTHNNLVVQLVTFRSKRNADYWSLYDFYYSHLLFLADTIYQALV